MHLEWFKASEYGDVDTLSKFISLGFNVNTVDEDYGFGGKYRFSSFTFFIVIFNYLFALKILNLTSKDHVVGVVGEKKREGGNFAQLHYIWKLYHKDGKVVRKQKWVKFCIVYKNIYLLSNIFLGKTSLIYAAKNGHIEVVKLLLENNANVEAKDYDFSKY